jgi:hypothetical protein
MLAILLLRFPLCVNVPPGLLLATAACGAAMTVFAVDGQDEIGVVPMEPDAAVVPLLTPLWTPLLALMRGELDTPPHFHANAGPGAPTAAAATIAASAIAQDVAGRKKALVRMDSSSRRERNTAQRP